MSSYPKIYDYFVKFDIDESHVVKFQHQNDVKELTLIVCTDGAHNFEAMSVEERERFTVEHPYVDVHKLVFRGVNGYSRRDPISPQFRDMEDFEESSGDGIILIMYDVENVKHERGYKFSAVLSGFGEISFNYSELSVEFKKLIEKLDSCKRNIDRLYFDMETGNVNHIPELFDEKYVRIGDTVLLKSGGPEMTIESLNQKNGKLLAGCTWFDNGNRQYKDVFSSDMLILAQDSLNNKVRSHAN